MDTVFLLTLLLVGLKLADRIDCGWLWVFSFIWGPYAIIFFLFALGFSVQFLSVRLRESFNAVKLWLTSWCAHTFSGQ
jgi:hypothetical protein